MKKAIVYFMWVLLSVGCFSSTVDAETPTFEMGRPVENGKYNFKAIDDSPFYLEYKEFVVSLHNVETGASSPIQTNINVLRDRSYDEDGGRDMYYTFLASQDASEILATYEKTGDMLRIQQDGTTKEFDVPFDSSVTRVVAYDVRNQIIVWKHRETNQLSVTDLTGALKWERALTGSDHVMVDTVASSVIAFNTRTNQLQLLDLHTGEVVETRQFPSSVDDWELELTTHQLVFQDTNALLFYDLTKQTVTRVDTSHLRYYPFDRVTYHDGLYYGLGLDDLVIVDLAEGQVTSHHLDTFNSRQDYELVGSTHVLQKQEHVEYRIFPLDRLDVVPGKIRAWLKPMTDPVAEHVWIGESYQVMAKVATLGEKWFDVPMAELDSTFLNVYSNVAMDASYVIPSLEAATTIDWSFGFLTNRQTFTPIRRLPLTIDTSFGQGAVGDVTGTTAPFATVYLHCTNEVYASCATSTQADATGRFVLSQGIIGSGQDLTVYASNQPYYSTATEASMQQKVTVPETPAAEKVDVLTQTSMEGVTIRTKPFARMEVRQLQSKTSFKVTEVQANREGIARLTTHAPGQPLTYRVFYRFLEPMSPYAMLVVNEDYPTPDVTWPKQPKTGDTTITVTYNGTLDPLLSITRDGKGETAKRLVPGENVLKLKSPLREGERVKVVASFRPELAKTYERTVTSDTPKVLTVQQVVVGSTTSTFTISKDAAAWLEFIVNGKRVSYENLGSNRYRVTVKPGTKLQIEASIGSKRKTMQHTLPSLNTQAIALTDEMNRWSGKTFPNATVTLKNGTKVIATSKANSTGSFILTFSRQKANTRLTLDAKAGVHQQTKTAMVKAGVRPTVTVGTIRSSTKNTTVRTNVSYGTLYVYNGKTLLAKKTITGTSTSIAIKPQKRGAKLRFQLVTPMKRSGETIQTVK